MARIFSIQFMYEGVEHHAMISMRNTPFFAEYAVAMLNPAIESQLPNNKIISSSKDSFMFSDSARENDPLLMQAIIDAVVRHLHAVDA